MLSAVETAQVHGVRVHLWGIEPPFGRNQAEQLIWECDTHQVISTEEVRSFVPPVAVPVAAYPTPPVDTTNTTSTARAPTPAMLAGRQRLPTAAVAAGGPSEPDGVLLFDIGEHIAHRSLMTRGRDHLADLLPVPILPGVIDQELLIEAEKELGRSLRPLREARERLRDGFSARVHREFGFAIGTSG